jgi:Holliday junction resolvasome RuvABC endonuclease subunit
MVAVIGVDASSTRLAAVVLDGKMLHTEHKKLPGDIDRACQEAHGWMEEVCAEYAPRLVAVEAPFFHHRHPQGSVGMVQVNGALLAALKDRVSLSVQPSRWKRQVCGVGNATKDQIVAWLKSNHPIVLEAFSLGGKIDQDLCDAFCVALYGLNVLEIRAKLLVRR